MKKFLIKWKEETLNHCTVEIEAETKELALKKWKEQEYYLRDEHFESVESTILDKSESAEEI